MHVRSVKLIQPKGARVSRRIQQHGRWFVERLVSCAAAHRDGDDPLVRGGCQWMSLVIHRPYGCIWCPALRMLGGKHRAGGAGQAGRSDPPAPGRPLPFLPRKTALSELFRVIRAVEVLLDGGASVCVVSSGDAVIGARCCRCRRVTLMSVRCARGQQLACERAVQ